MTYRLVLFFSLGALLVPPAHAAGDAAMGAKLFIQCRACHSVEPGEPNRVGPNLSGVVGSRAATQAKYVYSPAMAQSGLVWNDNTLATFLTLPSALVPGTKMAFAGVAAQKARADIIAYLATLKGARR